VGVSRVLSVVFALLLVSGLAPLVAGPASGPSEPDVLDLHRNLPKDPLLAFALIVEDPEQEVQAALDFLGELGGEEYRQAVADTLAGLNEALGASVQTDLLPLLGPQITLAVDLPPIDFAMLALSTPSHESLTAVLGRIGVVAEVRDPERLDAELRSMMERAYDEIVTDGEIVGVRIPIWVAEGDAPEEETRASFVTLQYLMRDGRIAVGFSAAWIQEALQAGPAGEKLGSGDDFVRVFSQLDERATRLSYVNLPKIRTLVSESHILSAVLEDNPQTQELLRTISNSEVMEMGLGSTAVAMNGGVRTIHFGPPWLSSAVLSDGVLAAMAVPALISSQHDEPDETTTGRIAIIGAACEGFSSDTQTYPPAEGWVTVEKIAPYLEPLYGRALPRFDTWENPILYWTDGDSYRIVSTGEDGRMDRDWAGTGTPGPPAEGGADIVYGNGNFLVAP
jgi:hypothetical protein